MKSSTVVSAISLPRADDDQLIGHQRHLAHQVRGHEDRAALVREVAQEVADPADALGIESVHRLVEDQRLGVAEQCRRDAEPLTHAEREAADALPGHLLQPHQIDHLVDAAGRDAVRLGEREQVVVGRAPGVIACASSIVPTSCSGASWSR